MASTGTISSLGIGSGLNLSNLLTSLMAMEQKPLNDLTTKEATVQAKISAYGSMSSSVSSLQSAVDALKSSTLYSKNTATSSDTTVFSGTANTAATAGTYNLNVVSLASAQTLTSQTFASQTSSVSVDEGQLKIEIGSYSNGTFTANSSSSPVTVSIPANASLDTIRDQINAANAGVTAKVVQVDSAGTQFKLAITSNTSGASGSLRITAQDGSGNALTTDNTGLAQLSYDPTKTSGNGNEYTVATAAADAHIQVNGVDLYRSGNTVGDAITGVTLNLAKTGSASLTVATDTSSIQTAIQSFVTAYNSTVSLGRQLSNYDSSTKTAGVLNGDSTMRNLLSQFNNLILDTTGPSSTSSLTRLSDLGLSIQKDGSLALDSTKLQNALTNNLSDVTSMLSATGSSASSQGIAVQLSTQFGNLISSTGILTNQTTSLQSQVTSIENQRTALQLRLSQIQANYTKQFTALDSTIASMQSTASYLTTQLASLSKSTSS